MSTQSRGGYSGTEDEFALACASLKSDPLYGKTVTCFGDSLMTGYLDSGEGEVSDKTGFARIIKERHPGATVYNYGQNGTVMSTAACTLAANNGGSRTTIAAAIAAVCGDPTTYPGGADPDYIVIDGYGNDYVCLAWYGTDSFNDVFGTPDVTTWPNVGYDTVYNSLDCIFRYLCSSFPTTKIVFISPYTSTQWGLSLATQFEVARNVAGICAKYGVAFFDLGNTMLGYYHDANPYTNDNSFFQDEFHMNESGYDFIADGLDDCLLTGISNNYYKTPDTLDVTLSGNILSTSVVAYTADHTCAEIAAAYASGKTVRVTDAQGIIMPLSYVTSAGVYVFGATMTPDGSNFYSVCCYTNTSLSNTVYGVLKAL